MRVYGYLRASTQEQDADRAKDQLYYFAEANGLTIAHCFRENESGATLNRPKLFELLDIAQPGDVLLVEQVDRISRLNSKDWESLKATITSKGIRVVALDLPMSHQHIRQKDEFTGRMLSAVNAMMLDMLAAVARKDYEDRRRRLAQGIQRAKAEKKYKGRPDDVKLQSQIEGMLRDGKSYGYIVDTLKCSKTTISKVKKRILEESGT